MPHSAQWDAIRARLEDGAIFQDLESQWHRKDGTIVTVGLSASPLQEAFDTNSGACLIIEDISTRGLVQRQRLADFAAIGNDILWECDTEGRLSYLAGPSGAQAPVEFEALPGRSLKEIADLGFFARGDVNRLMRRITEDDVFQDQTVRSVSRQGKRRFWQFSGKPVKAGTGETLGYRGVAREITALKRIEEDLQRALETSQAANTAKQNFLANMSHELRTPLNAIIGFSEIMATQLLGPLNRNYMNYAEDIHKSGGDLLKIINDILEISKLDSEGGLEREQPVAVYEAVADCLERMAPFAARAGIELINAVPQTAPSLIANRERLAQMIGSLAENAVKFSDEGSTVTVGLVEDPESFGIAVRDQGIGMDPKQLPAAVEAFTQLHTGLNRAYEGTGLGLTLVRHFAALHGGELHIETALGEGTTATLLFPANRLENAEAL